ncbi:hypothetical protein NHJ6243_009397 [Beauveria neobassiana]
MSLITNGHYAVTSYRQENTTTSEHRCAKCDAMPAISHMAVFEI